jgi:hypothetical protein
MAVLEGLGRTFRLNLRHTPVSDEGLARLKALTGITELYVHGFRMTEKGVAELERSMRPLKVIRGCPCAWCAQAGCGRDTRCVAPPFFYSAGSPGSGPPPPPAPPASSAPRAAPPVPRS